jgi:two-component system, oxyanion-binding sensor
MSQLIELSARQSTLSKMRIGLLRLTDGAPVIAAHEFGFFIDEGVEVELFVEPSWANIADKLAHGFFDAAVIIPPLAFAVQLGLRGTAAPLLIPYAISAGGNTVSLARGLAEEVDDLAARRNLSRVEALAQRLREQNTTLGVVHAYSTHSLLLRYWLATTGIEAERDFKLAVVPPAGVVEALNSGQIAGFCAGAPWGEVARRAGVGRTIAASRDIWRNAPEKALAVRARFAEGREDTLAGALRALLRSAKFCDDPKNTSYPKMCRRRPNLASLCCANISVPLGAMGAEQALLHNLTASEPCASIPVGVQPQWHKACQRVQCRQGVASRSKAT